MAQFRGETEELFNGNELQRAIGEFVIQVFLEPGKAIEVFSSVLSVRKHGAIPDRKSLIENGAEKKIGRKWCNLVQKKCRNRARGSMVSGFGGWSERKQA